MMIDSLRVQFLSSQSGSRNPLKKAPGLNRAFLNIRTGKSMNPSGGYPPEIHRISTLIGHKPEEIRWISAEGIYDFTAQATDRNYFCRLKKINLLETFK